MNDEIVTRQMSFSVTEVRDENDGLTLEGYAAMFNSPTEIDSMEGRFVEVISEGAFRKSIKDKGPRGIRLQFDHGTHPLIGSMPIGSIREIREDDRGLFISARLATNWLVEPVREAIAQGAVSGMSFRFRPIRQDWQEDDATGERTRVLREVELFEVGPVVWPAYQDTSVGVRAREIASALMDPEQRAEVARALLTGTSEDAADDVGTSDEAASDDAAELHVINRSDEFNRTVASIANYIEGDVA